MRQSTALAKLALRISGILARVFTYRKVYELSSWPPPPEDEGPLFTAERRWIPCGLSTRFLVLSQKLDNEHWGHWALDHGPTDGTYCTDCGGLIEKEDYS